MEAIRRSCYFDSSLWRKKFIVNRYYEVKENKNDRYKSKIEGHLFEKFPLEILCMAEEDKKQIAADFYWEGEVKFKTYEQAFLFFNRVGKLLKEPECILSNALSLSFDPKACNKLLKEYLSNPNIQYRDYANNLLNGTIETNLNDKTLTVFSEFYVTVRQGKEEILVREESNQGASLLTEVLKQSVEGFEKREYLYLPDLQDHKLRNYLLLKELEDLSLMTFVTKGEESKIHILDPRYWEAMNQYKVSEIEFVNCSYYDARKYDASLEGYKEIIGLDYQDLLSEVKRHRYLAALVSSVREVKDGVMKVKYYGQEEKLAYKKKGQEQVVDFLHSKLKFKDEKTMKLDKKYRLNDK